MEMVHGTPMGAVKVNHRSAQLTAAWAPPQSTVTFAVAGHGVFTVHGRARVAVMTTSSTDLVTLSHRADTKNPPLARSLLNAAGSLCGHAGKSSRCRPPGEARKASLSACDIPTFSVPPPVAYRIMLLPIVPAEELL